MNNDTARDQALARVASITAMAAALDLDWDELAALRDERNLSPFASRVLAERKAQGAPLAPNPEGWWEEHDGQAAEELAELEEAAGEYEDQDDAERAIHEDPLSVEVRSDWASPGEELTPSEYRIVLCTGGPHVELQGDLDQHGEPCSVRVLYRDWGTSGELFDFDRDAVLTYCRQHGLGS